MLSSGSIPASVSAAMKPLVREPAEGIPAMPSTTAKRRCPSTTRAVASSWESAASSEMIVRPTPRDWPSPTTFPPLRSNPCSSVLIAVSSSVP